jgi:serine/threonine protein kinase
LRGNALEQLTHDHRLWVSEDKSYLSRALGIHPQLELDYHSMQVELGDIFVLATDGVYEYAPAPFIIKSIHARDDTLDGVAKTIADEAYGKGSADNLTIQIVKVDELPLQDANELYQQLTGLPFPPLLEARMLFDGYTVVRELHASSRSHVYLAVDAETNTQVVIKIPSIDQRADPAYLERFLMEEWIARRIDSSYVLKPCLHTRKRSFLYIATEYIEGQTLSQWMIDHPQPDLETVRGIIEQIAKGLRAFHRLEMLHQDIRPHNIMIDSTSTVKIIDFGSAKVAGVMEIASPLARNNLLGTAQYTAPEYFLGEEGSVRSDIFSLGVMVYQMLTGKLPFGAEVAKTKTKAGQNKLIYQSVREARRELPVWVDEALRKAVHPNPAKRYEELSEFLFDLRHPNQVFLQKTRPPLLERNPVIFWKGVSLILAVILAFVFIK